MKKSILGVLGLSAAAAVALLAMTFAHAKEPAHGGMDHKQLEMFQDCAKACSECQLVCDGCVTHCASMMNEGKKEHATTLKSCQDCADICTAAARILSRGGPYSKITCQACADICAQCASECEKFPNDPHMVRCAEECRKCEKMCREMAKR